MEIERRWSVNLVSYDFGSFFGFGSRIQIQTDARRQLGVVVVEGHIFGTGTCEDVIDGCCDGGGDCGDHGRGKKISVLKKGFLLTLYR